MIACAMLTGIHGRNRRLGKERDVHVGNKSGTDVGSDEPTVSMNVEEAQDADH